MAARLIVEVDGSQHGLDAGVLRDARRTRWLEQEGYRVIRFWNDDVLGNIDGVLEEIQRALTATPTPNPLPTIRAFTPVFDGLWGEGKRPRRDSPPNLGQRTRLQPYCTRLNLTARNLNHPRYAPPTIAAVCRGTRRGAARLPS